MVADCLTKAMKDTFLMSVLNRNRWNFQQTDEARAIKERKQLQRSKTTRDDPEPGHTQA